MAIYHMNGKTFIDEFLDEDPDKILKSQFIIISSSLRKTTDVNEEQVINANHIFYPNTRLIMDYKKYKKNTEYINAYTDTLYDALPFLSTVIKAAIEEKMTVIFICAYKERKYNYLKMIENFVADQFGYPIYDYKKLKAGKLKQKTYDKAAVIKRCDKILKNAAKKQKETALSTTVGRRELLKKMSKDEMKAELKRRGLYAKGMDKDDMKDILDTFFVGE